jgi:hypothetical protein
VIATPFLSSGSWQAGAPHAPVRSRPVLSPSRDAISRQEQLTGMSNCAPAAGARDNAPRSTAMLPPWYEAGPRAAPGGALYA